MKQFKNSVLTCLFTIAFLFSTAVVEAGTYYTAVTGNDSNPGTEALPFRTITRGVGVLKPGDTLYVKTGLYPESFDCSGGGTCIQGGQAGAPIRIMAYPGHSVTIKPNTGGHVIRIIGANKHHIIIDGFILDAANLQTGNAPLLSTQGQFNGDYPHHNIFQNLELKNGPISALIIGGSGVPQDGCCNEIRNVYIHDCSLNSQLLDNASGIYIQSSDNLIEANTIIGMGGVGITLNYSNGSPPDRNIVRNNRVLNNGTSGGRGRGISSSEGIDNVIYNNLVYDNVGIGIHLYGSTRERGTKVFNNTIYQPSGFGIIIEKGNMDAVIRNNIIRAPLPIGNSGTNVSLSNNLTTDPLFVDIANKNFRVKPGSPAIDAGVALSQVTVDFDGIPRPQGTAYDIGAYEQSTGAPAPPKNLRVN